MSATIGARAALTMAGIARVESSSGQDTRTMSAPASSSARTWAIVACASAVKVLVIDWTVMGASPPTSTAPTRILRVGRRWIARQGRTCSRAWAVMTGGLIKPFGGGAQPRREKFTYGRAAGVGARLRPESGVIG